MSRSQTSFFVCDPVVYDIEFAALQGLARDTDIYQLNSTKSVIPQERFMFGQSKILGFERITSSPNPLDNGTPYLSGVYPNAQLTGSPVIVGGTTTEIEVYNPMRLNVLVLLSSSSKDTSVYKMYWVNEYANPEVAQSLGLVSQNVFPNPT